MARGGVEWEMSDFDAARSRAETAKMGLDRSWTRLGWAAEAWGQARGGAEAGRGGKGGN